MSEADTRRQRILRHLAADQHRQAATLAAELAGQQPQNLWAHLVASQSLYSLQEMTMARVYCERALALDPGNTVGLVLRARLQLYAGDHAAALETIGAAIALRPRDSFLHGVRAELLVDIGDLEGAVAGYLEALQCEPRNMGGLLGLASLPGHRVPDRLVKQTEFFLESGQLSAKEQVKAHFGLAQIYDARDDVPRHFAHLERGNALKRSMLHYDPASADREADALIEDFSGAFLRRGQASDDAGSGLIFIVGFPRCGSTLVEQILSSHPQVAAAGEVYALRYAIRSVGNSRGKSGGRLAWLDQPALDELAAGYLRRIEPWRRAPRLTDKALANFRYIGLIHVMFPAARIIHVRRDPVNTCYSCYRNLFDADAIPYAYSLDDLAGRYRAYRRIMDHWSAHLPGGYHNLDYEDLVTDQRATTAELLAWCDLAWDDACLDFHRNQRRVQTASNTQVRQQLYTGSLDRTAARAARLQPLLGLRSG